MVINPAINKEDASTWAPLSEIPHHVGMIMDGNGRWAKARGLPRSAGHKEGAENLRRILEGSVELGIKVLSVYAFSTENWQRPRAEVMGLMRLFEYYFDRELDELDKNGVQLRHVGKVEGVSPRIQQKIYDAVEYTKNNDRLILNVAFNYGGRDELVQAIRKMLKDEVDPNQVTEALISEYVYTKGTPDPDLIIRTSGEFRTSNFLLWQGAYAEYYFTPTYWPSFDKYELYKALVAYNERTRRYGGLK